jgi:ABC-type phosphate/phosphonate transport system substrate-binding protein
MRLTLGVPVHQNHAGTVHQYAPLVDYLDKTVTEELRMPVRFNVRLYETMTAEMLDGDRTDFVRISPLLYVEARARGRMLRPVVRPVNSRLQCRIITRAGSGLKNLADLRDRSLIFGEKLSAVTFWAKVSLVRNGIVARDLSSCDYIQPQRAGEFVQGGYLSMNSDPIRMVMKGQYDAGVALEGQIEQSQYRTNLVVLNRFECMDHLWVAASNTSNNVVRAFQRAMQNLRDPRVLLSMPDRPVSPRGFVADAAADYLDMEGARAIAAQFDSSHEPIESPSTIPPNEKDGTAIYEK